MIAYLSEPAALALTGGKCPLCGSPLTGLTILGTRTEGKCLGCGADWAEDPRDPNVEPVFIVWCSRELTDAETTQLGAIRAVDQN